MTARAIQSSAFTTASKTQSRILHAAPKVRFVAAAAAILLALPVLAQDRALSELLSGKDHPLSVKLKDLNSEWRRITLQAGARLSDNISVNVSGNTGGALSQNNIAGALAGSKAYLTKGETATVSGQTYLIAYHLPTSAFDIGTLLQALATKTPPRASLLTEDTDLPLALLNLRTIGSLDEVRAFDLKQEIQENEQAVRALADLFKAQAGSGSTNKPPSNAENPK